LMVFMSSFGMLMLVYEAYMLACCSSVTSCEDWFGFISNASKSMAYVDVIGVFFSFASSNHTSPFWSKK
jgi:hypothetical protein